MMHASNQKWPFVVNLGNSIIGVAILAMPFCFKQCGILLGALVLLACTWLTLASCQLLMKAGIISHYQSYEYLAFHTYGAPGKFVVEMGMIGMQLGTLVAQIVVIGDLGPPIISHLFDIENNWTTRLYLIIFLCLFVGLPLGLMKDLRNVTRASTICVVFYVVFSIYILWLSSGKLWTGEWYSHVNFWRPQGFFQCLPIMSFSFGCQTQLFIMYDALPEPSLQAIKGIIHSAVNLCAVAYLLVGFFGYVTFYHLDIPGDIIKVFPVTFAAHMIKLGFVMSIAITFPVIIFPCRASIYTLLFQKKSMHADSVTSTYIPEKLFKGITIVIVIGSMITGILIPNVEFILGLNGAITGTLICYIFPALFFLRVSKPEGKTVAQIVLAFGVAILLVSTFTTLYAQDQNQGSVEVEKAVQEAADRVAVNVPPAQDIIDRNERGAVGVHPKENKVDDNKGHLEPPNPFAPVADEKNNAAYVKPVDKQAAVDKVPVKVPVKKDAPVNEADEAARVEAAKVHAADGVEGELKKEVHEDPNQLQKQLLEVKIPQPEQQKQEQNIIPLPTVGKKPPGDNAPPQNLGRQEGMAQQGGQAPLQGQGLQQGQDVQQPQGFQGQGKRKEQAFEQHPIPQQGQRQEPDVKHNVQK